MGLTQMAWYNYRTEQHEERSTPTDFADYIPQIPPAQALYRLYMVIGDTPIESARKVLELCVRKLSEMETQ